MDENWQNEFSIHQQIKIYASRLPAGPQRAGVVPFDGLTNEAPHQAAIPHLAIKGGPS